MRSVSLPSVPADSAEPAANVPSTLVYASPQMHDILALVGRVAAGDAKVLITGESGVGKDLVAREIHARSARAPRAVHRGQLRRPDRDAARVRAVRSREGQFHRRLSRQARQAAAGASRHAVPRRGRRDEPAHAGAAAALPRERRNSGGRRAITSSRTVDVRVDCGDQPQSGRHGRQRAVPRGPALSPPRHSPARAAAARAQAKTSARSSSTWRRRPARSVEFTDEALRTLERYRWPGNVRELQNVVEQALWMASGSTVDVTHLPPSVQARPTRSCPCSERRKQVADELYQALVAGRLLVLGAHPPAVPGARHHAARHARAGAPRARRRRAATTGRCCACSGCRRRTTSDS